MGPSGSGKSTLLNIIGLLAYPSGGEVLLNGQPTSHLRAAERAALRNRRVGFVFQDYGLLADLTVWENVELPLLYAGVRTGRHDRVRRILAAVNMDEFSRRRPGQLSGGQQQRVAIARALVTDAPLILADEPTGALDSKTGVEVLSLMHSLCAQGRTLVIVTHDLNVARSCRRVLNMCDGQLVAEGCP